MTDQQINESIAKACGWTIEDGQCIAIINGDVVGFGLPTDDLNAMHQAEKTLEGDNAVLFVDLLCCIIHEVDQGYFDRVSWQLAAEIVNATARQRAEAFCKTLNLWRNE